MREIIICAVLFGMFAGADCVGENQPLENAERPLVVSVRNGAALAVARRRWDPALRNWMFLMHCVRPGDCIPFWMSAADLENYPQIRRSIRNLDVIEATAVSDSVSEKDERREVLVRRGEKAKLLWQVDGIRAELPAICLDDAQMGEAVRARIPATGVVLRAVVVGKGKLRSDENAR